MDQADSDPRLQYSLSTPPVHHKYSSTTRLTRLGVPFEKGVSFGQILQKARVENRPSPSARIWHALDHTPPESNASSRIPAAGRNQVQGTRVDLLSYANAGRIISRDELLSKVWKCQQTMTTRTVDQTISSLRRKLGDDAESPRYSITVYGVGYTLGAFTSYASEPRKTARALR